MKRSIKTEEYNETEHEFTICDRCGREAENPAGLYRGVERAVHDNLNGETAVEYRLDTLYEHVDGHTRGYTFAVHPGTMLVEEWRSHEADVELCGECYELVFGWGE